MDRARDDQRRFENLHVLLYRYGWQGALGLLDNHGMSLLKVARMGHPVLRTRARELERAELKQPSMQKLIDDMIDTMHGTPGSVRESPDSRGARFSSLYRARGEEPLAPDAEPGFINPSSRRRLRAIRRDGRVPQHPRPRGRVPRARVIQVTGMDRFGGKIDIVSHDFPARVIHTKPTISTACCFRPHAQVRVAGVMEDTRGIGRRIGTIAPILVFGDCSRFFSAARTALSAQLTSDDPQRIASAMRRCCAIGMSVCISWQMRR